MKLLKYLDEHAERTFMLVCYCFIVFVIVSEVFRRFVLSYSSAWGEEGARYAFIYLGWVGAAYAVKERAHIRFDILLNRIPARLRPLLFAFTEVCTIVFALIALRWSMHAIGTLMEFGATTPVLRVQKAWFEAAVPIGCALIVLRSLQRLVSDVADWRAGRDAFAGKAMFDE